MKRTRNIFAGGNTGKGFFSYFGDFVATGTRRAFILKGGPGVGKSTFMKAVAAPLIEAGKYEVEMFFCSFDPTSLDGLAVPELGIILIDGTSPHMTDPRYPGAVEDIINLADCLNGEALRPKKAQIKASGQEVSRWFRRASCYIGAAGKVFEDLEGLHWDLVDKDSLRNMAYTLEKSIFPSDTLPRQAAGRRRHFFGSAYTASGYVEQTASLLAGYERITYLDGPIGAGRTYLMKFLTDRATQLGLTFDVYHTALASDKIQTVVFPELKAAVTASDLFRNNYHQRFDLEQNMDLNRLAAQKQEISEGSERFKSLLDKGIQCLAQAKQAHSVLEGIYGPNMDFSQVDRMRDKVLNEVLQIANAG